MWKVFLLYWLVIVGATAAIKLLGSPWPPVAGILVPIGWMAALASLIVTCAMVAQLVERRRALKRRRAIEALDALNITSASSRAQFLGTAGPFMHLSWSEEDALANRLWALFDAIRSHPESSMDFGELHELQGAARQQRDLEAWSRHWQPTVIRDLFPEFGPGSQATAGAGGILFTGGLIAGAILVDMTAGPLWALLAYALGMVALSLLLGILHRRLDRYRRWFRTAAPDLFSEDGSPKIPQGYDRTRN